MEWLAENWFLILVTILFLAVHLFAHGHGGHGGHGKQDGDHEGYGGHSHKYNQDSGESPRNPEDDKNKHQHH